jgi:hypothetical protein
VKLLLVHLVRRHNGPAPLKRFLESYTAHPPGADHELLLALKGFDAPPDAEPSLAAARSRGLDPGHIYLPDDGMDLTAYARVVSAVPAERYCFVNSFSRVLADRWLGQLSAALDQPGVALAGATGSWASHQDFRRYQLHLRSGYDDVFEGREATRLGFLTLARQRTPTKRDNGRLAFKAIAALDMVRDRNAFDPFPAPHLRTNAFIAERGLMVELGVPRIRRKRDAYRLESGPASFTRRVEDLGARAVVVGRDGSLYDSPHWHESITFWQGTQQNMLVADNQTDDYANAEPRVRQLLSQFAWGSRAQPS